MTTRILLFTVLILLSARVICQKTDLLLPSPMDREQIIHHKGYSMSYNSSYVQPSWVAYKVTKSQINKDEKVKTKFIKDPEIHTRSGSVKDYKEGGYIMAQFVNYKDVKQIQGAVPETFYMSNITPMKQVFYNQIWLKTEEMIRLWSNETDGLYVVCGPILAEAPFPTIGENNISVPNRFYKVVYDLKNQKAVGFIFKNGTSSGKLKSFAMSVDEVEQRTGIDLFSGLEDVIEKMVEAKYDPAQWNWEVIE